MNNLFSEKAPSPHRVRRLHPIAGVALMSALIFSGTACADTVTFTNSHWTPGANPFVTPINPYQYWSFNLNSWLLAHPDAEIMSAVLTINAWNFDTADSVVNTVLGNASTGYAYFTYYEDDYNYSTHDGALFDPD